MRRWWAWPLVPVYWAGLRVKDGLRRVGVLRVRRLGWPVVSVGSLSAGGAGKTPVVMALVELLQERGWAVDVLSRGYGRRGIGVERVNVNVEGAAARFGDEPALIAQRTGVAVWVGAERYDAGVAAEVAGNDERSGRLLPQTIPHPSAESAEGWATRFGGTRRVHLLDDGFQHGRLARAMDVVVVTAEDLEDAMLPAGNRREGLGALRRADAFVVREEELGRVVPRLRGWVRRDAAIWAIRRRVGFSGGGLTDVGVSEAGWVVFSAIARPGAFLGMVREAGVCEVGSVSFPDHHAYGVGDMKRLVETAKRLSGRGFVTTEKDAVKLTQAMRTLLEAVGPLMVARLETSFVDEEDVCRAVEARIA